MRWNYFWNVETIQDKIAVMGLISWDVGSYF